MLVLDTDHLSVLEWEASATTQKVGRNKRSVSGMDARAGNGLRPYPGLRNPLCLLAQMKTAVA